MGVTSNYSFPVPVATDLVKDGWDAINDLGVAVDTAMNTALGTKKAGMVLLNTTSFSGVASQAIPANSFSATYDNYRIILDISAVTADAAIYLKLRGAGSDNSTSYYFGALGITSAGTTTNDNGNNVTTGFLINAVDSASNKHYYTTDILLNSPFLAVPTTIIFPYIGLTAAGAMLSRYGSGWHDVSTSYDAVNIIASSGNITGTVRVYGVNQ